jgi:hypothetical protein
MRHLWGEVAGPAFAWWAALLAMPRPVIPTNIGTIDPWSKRLDRPAPVDRVRLPGQPPGRGLGSFKRETRVAGPEVFTTEVAEGTEGEGFGIRFPDLSPWNGRVPSREGLARPSEASGIGGRACWGRRAQRTLPGFPSRRNTRGESAGLAGRVPSREGLARPSEASGIGGRACWGRRAQRTLPGFPSRSGSGRAPCCCGSWR